MDEIYAMMKEKLEQMHREKSDKVVFTFDEFRHLLAAVNYMKKVDNIMKNIDEYKPIGANK